MISSEEKTAGIIAIIAIAIGGVLFGFPGARTILALVLMAFPFYLLLRLSPANPAERLCYALVIGITIIPSLAYWLGFIIPFSIALGLVIIALSLLAVGIGIFLKKKQKSVPIQENIQN